MSLAVRSSTRLQVERLLLRINLRYRAINEEIRRRTKVKNIIERIGKKKWSCTGPAARQEETPLCFVHQQRVG